MSGLYDRLQDELNALKPQEGLSPSDLLNLPPAIADLIGKLTRRNGMKLAEIAQELDQGQENTQKILDELVAKGYIHLVKIKQESLYKARFLETTARFPVRHKPSSLWSVLDDKVKKQNKT